MTASSAPLLLSIDYGTQSVRAMVFDARGELLCKSKVDITPYFSTAPGLAEQHPAYYWEQLCFACHGLWAQMAEQGLSKDALVACALTTQRDTSICLDKNNNVLRPAILWLDQRLATAHPTIPWYWRSAFSLAQQKSTVNYFQSKAKANWLAQHEAALWENTDKYMLLSAYLNFRLTGEFHDSSANTVGYLPFDYKKQQWASKNDWKWSALPISRSQLPSLFTPGSTLGEITNETTQQTGIPAKLPVIAAASDKACEVLGSGCFEPTTASLSYGTTATVNTNNTRYIEPSAFVPPYPSAIPHQYNTEVMIYRGFWMVSWFKQEFGLREQQQAKSLGVSPESLFDQLVDKVPPGSEGLMLQPYWSPSIKNLEARGAILGFSDVHTRAHIYRAILEGLAYALKEGKERIEQRQRCKIDTLKVSGGGSQSNAAMQLTADIFNLPAERPHTFETSGLGAAINAAVGMGLHSDYQSAAKAMTRIADTFEPIRQNTAVYQALYEDIYKSMYSHLKPIYKRMQQITEAG